MTKCLRPQRPDNSVILQDALDRTAARNARTVEKETRRQAKERGVDGSGAPAPAGDGSAGTHPYRRVRISCSHVTRHASAAHPQRVRRYGLGG